MVGSEYVMLKLGACGEMVGHRWKLLQSLVYCQDWNTIGRALCSRSGMAG